jgi:hypothetical protein
MILPQPPDRQATAAHNKKGLTLSGLFFQTSVRLLAFAVTRAHHQEGNQAQ